MFEWESFLDVAHDLAGQVDNEAALRSAISRAYYAGLGLAHERLIESGWTMPRGSIHHHVWRMYAGSTDPRRREIGRLGFMLRNQRNDADYKRLFPLPLPKTATDAVRFSGDLIALLEELDTEET